jgi:hypothetical protein
MKPSTGQYWLALPTLLLTIAAPQLAAAKDIAPSPNMIAGTAIPWVPGVGSTFVSTSAPIPPNDAH